MVYMVLVLVVVAGLSFYGGLKYGESKGMASQASVNGSGRAMSGAGGRGMGARGGAGFTGGQVLSIDATSMTLQARDGSSRIIFFTSATPIMKEVGGKVSDVVVGSNVNVTGTPNTDGSITAQSIQLRPKQ